jgi:hypothetical protein
VQPLVRAALAVGVLALVSGLAAQRAARPRQPPGAPEEGANGREEPTRMPCGPREIPEGEACVPLPAPAARASASPGASDEPADEDAARGRIPRRPDRPADVLTLQLPLADAPALLPSGSDPAIGGGDADLSVLRLGSPRGTPVIGVPLRGEEGAAEVLAVEKLPGRGLVVAALASTTEGKREDRWLVLYGALDGAGPGLTRGSKLRPGAVVGFVGDSLVPGEPHLRFEVRRLRRGVDVEKTALAQLVGDAESVAIDARNVLAPR